MSPLQRREHVDAIEPKDEAIRWIPAFAGMTAGFRSLDSRFSPE
jgi:hypothetical protein